jgi:hypothetical protein
MLLYNIFMILSLFLNVVTVMKQISLRVPHVLDSRKLICMPAQI